MDQRVDRVYVGGYSIISALGGDLSESLRTIESYQTNITHWGSTPLCAIDRSRLEVSSLGDYTFAEQLVIMAVGRVATGSGVDVNNPRTAIILSTTKGNVELLNQDFDRTYLWALANSVERYFGRENSSTKIISTACISGVAAIAIGARMVEHSEADNVFVVGVDTLNDFIVDGFNSFKSISPTLCRPYDAERDGLTAGEGCGVMLLTREAQKSSSRVVVSGSGLSNDANHISGPSRTGDGLFFAMQRAIKEAQLTSKDIDYVNLHGTGTLFNDEMESKAMNLAKLTSTPCNSLKPYLGHTYGASGVIESILVVEQVVQNRVFGVKGYEQNGVPHALNISSSHRGVEIRHALKTASGFGGTNAALVFSKMDDNQEAKSIEWQEVEVVEVARYEIDSRQTELPFGEFIKGEYKALEDANLKFFKMDSLSKLGYVASCRLLNNITLDIPQPQIGIVLANRSSSLQSDLKHQSIVDQKLPEGASPAVFVYTLPNIVASEIAIKHKFQGETVFFVEEEKSMSELKRYAHKIICRGACDAVVYGWCELLGEEYNVELILIKKR